MAIGWRVTMTRWQRIITTIATIASAVVVQEVWPAPFWANVIHSFAIGWTVSDIGARIVSFWESHQRHRLWLALRRDAVEARAIANHDPDPAAN